MRRLPGILLLAALAAAAVPSRRAGAGDDDPPAAPPLTPPTPEERAKKVAEEKERLAREHKAFVLAVDAAIDKGKAWLLAQQAGDGSFKGYSRPGYEVNVQDLGVQSLCLLTLVKCGSTELDPEIKRGLQFVRSFYRGRKGSGGLKTYSAACFVMFLEALYRKEPKGEKANGDPAKRAAPPTELPLWAQEEVKSIVEWLASNEQEGYWPYPGPPGKADHEDLSNTQYALLGLQTASRCGIEAQAAVYTTVLEHLLSKQERDGPEVARWIENPAYEPGGDDRYGPFLKGRSDHARGFGYGTRTGNDAATGSMTAAGLSSLCIVKDRLRALNALPKEVSSKIDRALLDGMAWLSEHFAVDKNPEKGTSWLRYYLYGLERAGAYLGNRCFGQHDWYVEGAKSLIGTQAEDGGWPGEKDPPSRALESCFALLFLKRATVPPAKPVAPTTTGD